MKSNGKKARQHSVNRPPRLIYLVLSGLIFLYAVIIKRQKIKSTLKEKIKPPFIIIGNHTSFYDFVYSIRAFYPQRINYVVARKYFHFPWLGGLLKLSRAIPKSLYQADLNSVIGMLHVLREGGIVGIFPEGQISTHGVTLENGDSTAKLIKKAGVPVVRILTGGAYLKDPPWAKFHRKGIIESKVDLILSREQIEASDIDTLAKVMDDSLFIDAFAWQRETGNLYNGKNLAHGLENILYICPRCHGEFTFLTAGDRIICDSCKLEAIYGNDAHLHWNEEAYFLHVGEWCLWQAEQEKNRIHGTVEYFITEPVELAMFKQSGRGTEPVGRGNWSASRKGYSYQGSLRGEAVQLFFPVSATRYFPFDAGQNFQIYDKNLLYEFRPENPVFCMKAANICDALAAGSNDTHTIST
ncbi:MAG: 1-acyl-sn-glycerol-3-phosphate acyltransferase [Clostridiales bacterium]|nr:1-acyl-sn-glycerol-3-phosphate acyltransferase [Clostridiales bacterium]